MHLGALAGGVTGSNPRRAVRQTRPPPNEWLNSGGVPRELLHGLLLETVLLHLAARGDIPDWSLRCS